MLYLVAVLVAAAVAVTLWKLLGPERGPGRAPDRSVIAPDDDPDFLRELDERARRDEDET